MKSKLTEADYIKLIEDAEHTPVKILANNLNEPYPGLQARIQKAKHRIFINDLIRVREIDHKNQRYDTCGDWQFTRSQYSHKDKLEVKISRTKRVEYGYLLAVHEIIEAILCVSAGISEQEVDKWDMNFKGKGEPGDDPNCPYHKQHKYASAIETEMAIKMGINWEDYEKEIDSL